MKFILYTVIALCVISLPLKIVAQTTADTSWFADVTAKVGLYTTNIGAMVAVDVNNDDYPDLITLSGGILYLGPPGLFGSDTSGRLFLNEQRPGSSDPKDRIFVDATAGSGLNVPGVIKDMASMGDFNNDGNVDLVVNCWYFDSTYNFSSTDPQCPPNVDTGQYRLRILLGDGHGHFTLKRNSGLEALGPISGTGLPTLDYDRDGNLDLYVSCLYDAWCFQRPIGSHLMHGNGDGTFTDATVSSGIQNSQQDPAKPWLNPPAKRAYFGANVADWNNDCYPDIFACPYEATGYPFGAINGSNPTPADTENTQGYGNLYKNNGDGTFTDVGVTANWAPHFNWADQGMVPWAAMPADYNNDGNLDYLVLEVHGANHTSGLYQGKTTVFTSLGPANNYKLQPNPAQIIRHAPQNITHGDHNGFWCDFNNDGWQDLMFGDAAYDLTSQGYPDAQRMFFCLQDSASHSFNDITTQLGFIKNPGASSIQQKIRRPAVMLPVDFDLDGDDDIIKCPYNSPQDTMLVLLNKVANKSNRITIKLVAPDGVNKSCIGARVTVKTGNIKQMREVYGDQGSWTNQNPFILNFGIGHRTRIDSIDIRWPDGNCNHTIVTDVAANQFLRIGKDGILAVAPVVPLMPDNFELYPNPATGVINLSFTHPFNATVEIYNSIGVLVVYYKEGYNSSFTIPVNRLQAGLYFVHVLGGNNVGGVTRSFIKTN